MNDKKNRDTSTGSSSDATPPQSTPPSNGSESGSEAEDKPTSVNVLAKSTEDAELHKKASLLHGWEDEHAATKTWPSLKPSDYQAALEAAKESKRHGPAVSKHMKRSVDEWGRIRFPITGKGVMKSIPPDAWKHTAAAAMHGWNEHAHHAGQPMRLSEADYDKALEAAGDGRGSKAHAAAVSAHCPRVQREREAAEAKKSAKA
jgi:hypothetical protein